MGWQQAVGEQVKHPIIITGAAFDWEAGSQCASDAVDNDGNINWFAAFGADPGVMKCPNTECGIYLWNEGERVRCPDCAHEFDTKECR